MFEIGTIKYGRELGYANESDKYIWHICIDCLQPRWIRFLKGRPIHIRCKKCFDKISSKLSGVALKGKFNPAWRGGVSRRNSYIYIYMPDHHRVTTQGYVRRSILVLEQKLNRHLKYKEQVHHINGIKDDDRPENLMPLMIGDHTSLHHKGKGRRK